MSVVDEAEDFDPFPTGDVLVAPAPAIPTAAQVSTENGTHNAKNNNNNTKVLASFVWQATKRL